MILLLLLKKWVKIYCTNWGSNTLLMEWQQNIFSFIRLRIAGSSMNLLALVKAWLKTNRYASLYSIKFGVWVVENSSANLLISILLKFAAKMTESLSWFTINYLLIFIMVELVSQALWCAKRRVRQYLSK